MDKKNSKYSHHYRESQTPFSHLSLSSNQLLHYWWNPILIPLRLSWINVFSITDKKNHFSRRSHSDLKIIIWSEKNAQNIVNCRYVFSKCCRLQTVSMNSNRRLCHGKQRTCGNKAEMSSAVIPFNFFPFRLIHTFDRTISVLSAQNSLRRHSRRYDFIIWLMSCVQWKCSSADWSRLYQPHSVMIE